MAGIGFELQRVLKGGGIGSFVKVALSGIMIVAGPWLLSIIGIFLIGRFAGFALREGRSLFMSVVIYSYAFSLFFFGGSHYIFTRLVSDFMYQEKKRESGSSLLFFSVIILLISLAIALVVIKSINIRNITHPGLFKISALAFFVLINIIWLLMIFISLLKRYLTIFFVFVGGITSSVLGVSILGRFMALGGAMLGFSLGQLITVVLLFVLAFRDFKPGHFSKALKDLIIYFPKYKFLFLSGLFYYWGIWIDKMVFWIGVGQRVPGTFFRLFDFYDIPVYFSNLTMIPGLIYFIVVCETGFYTHLKEFLLSLSGDTYRSIREKKYMLTRAMREGLREQSLFQIVLTAFFIILAPTISRLLFGEAVDSFVLRVVLLAVFFQFLYLTLMTFLFYFELYLQSFLSSFVFFVVNLAGSLFTVLSRSGNLYGFSYLNAGLAASIAAAVFLFSASKNIERLIFSRYGAP